MGKRTRTVEPVCIWRKGRARKRLWIGIVALLPGLASTSVGVYAAERTGDLTGVAAIVFGLALVLLGILALRSYGAIKQTFLRIGPAGITWSSVAGRVDIDWNEIAWVDVFVDQAHTSGRNEVTAALWLASTYGFHGRADMEAFRDDQLPGPYTHAFTVVTDMKIELPLVDGERMVAAVTAFGGHRFAGSNIQ